MLIATDTHWEQERLAAVYRTALLDTPPEPEFDELVRIAAAICGVSRSIITLLDDKRQWCKAAFGGPPVDVDRNISFCQHVIKQDALMEIQDAQVHPLVSDNPLVNQPDGIRFYAGFPVQSPDGHNVGTLCVFDNQPHELNETQRAALVTLASQANARIELRMQRLALERALHDAQIAKASAEASDTRFKAFMDAGPFLSLIKDADGKLVYYNQPFTERFGGGSTDWLGRSNRDRHGEHTDAIEAHDQLVLATDRPHVFLEETQDPQGRYTQWRSFKFPVHEPDGSSLLGVITLDVTEELAREAALRRSQEELKEANRKLQLLATSDPLTGLSNRRVFDERLQLEFARAQRRRGNLAVLMIDVDNFKRCNDTHGHDYGDRVLKQLSRVLRTSIRETDLAARFGGEEFVVLFPDADEAQALEKADVIVKGMHAETWEHAPCTVSIGVAALDAQTPNSHALVTLADYALYAAKKNGKDRAVGYVAHADLRG